MATRKRKSTKRKGRCQMVKFKGGTRRICRDAKGRIKSVGKATKRKSSKKRSTKKASGGAMKRVSRTAATHKSGAKKGKLKKGCKFGKNGQAYCRRSR